MITTFGEPLWVVVTVEGPSLSPFAQGFGAPQVRSPPLNFPSLPSHRTQGPALQFGQTFHQALAQAEREEDGMEQ